MCKANSDYCKTCYESGCNSKIDLANCTVSSSSLHDKIEAPLVSKICNNYNDTCFVHVVDDVINRGCLQEYVAEKNLPINFLKVRFNSSMYRTCSTPMCNDDQIEAEFCIACDSNDDENCRSNVTTLMRSRCLHSQKPLGCYHYETEDKRVQRGCVSEATEDIQNTCKSDNNLCKTCFGHECNSKSAFQRCLSCDYSQSGPNPSQCESKICTEYFDECYTHIGGSSVKRGCMSDTYGITGVDWVTDCENKEICKKCSGISNCNKEPIQEESCIVCDTNTLRHCNIFPDIELSEQCPFKFEPMGCFLYSDDKNFTKRGCMANETISVRNECLENGETCKTCFGENCNLKKSFQECHVCDSNGDGRDCIDRANTMKKEMCPNYLDQCYTHLEKGVVKRGCIGDTVIPVSENCANDDRCQRCDEGSGCNNRVFSFETCIVCDSKLNDSCRTMDVEIVEECELKSTQMGCYHFISQTDNDVRRGCMSNLKSDEIEKCRTNGTECKMCIGNNCNQKLTFETCHICDSADDKNCISDLTQMETSVCKQYNDVCFTHIGQNIVTRGCLLEMDKPFIDECHKLDRKCKRCTSNDGNICNTETLSIEKCIECDSIYDIDCTDNPSDEDSKICGYVGSTEKQGCFMKVTPDFNRVKRGCVNELDSYHKDECNTKQDLCKICDEDNCNLKAHFQQCYTCNSTYHSDCLKVSEESTPLMICEEYMASCMTGIDRRGYTHRRCRFNKTIEEDDVLVEFCEENKCNDNIYPDDRLQCFQCEGTKECEFLASDESENGALESQPCSVYSQYDQCFTLLDSKGKMHRGCTTDSTDSRILCENDAGWCEKCFDNECNNEPKFKQANLACLKCNNSMECAFQLDEDDRELCTSIVKIDEHETCYTYNPEHGDVVERGCTLDSPLNNKFSSWCKIRKDCEECGWDGCNRENKKYHSCVKCDNTIAGNEDCDNPKDIHAYIHDCDGTSYSFEKRGCYTLDKGNN